MSSTPLQTSSSSIYTGLQALWRSPTLVVTRFLLRSHIRSGWILGDIVYIWFLYALFFLAFGGDVPYFYGTAGQGLYLLSILSTIVMTHRALNARVYLPLARLTTRSAYLHGLMIATGVLRIPSFLLTLLLALGYHEHVPIFGIEHATFATMLPGALGLLINSILLSTLTVLLSVPIATRSIQIIFLSWLTAVLYSNSNPGLIAQWLSFLRLPLAPIAACYTLGITGTFDLFSSLMLLVALGYIIALAYLADHLFRKRDLILY